jgi:hypothetical protein
MIKQALREESLNRTRKVQIHQDRKSQTDEEQISIFDNYFLSFRCRAPSLISPMNRVIQPEVKVTLV